MSRLLLTAGLLAISLVQCQAQSPRDVPESAKYETARRGGHVEMTGTIRSGLMAAALAPPADDSAKWFLTIVGRKGESTFEQMKSIIANHPDLRPWVDTVEPKSSTMHFQMRNIDDRTQADWLKGLQPAIDKFGLPMIVVQPPRNRQFGEPGTIVKAIHGFVPGNELAAKLREGIRTYVTSLETPIQSGIAHQPDAGAQPPFRTPPQPAPGPPPSIAPLAVDWPPSAPTALSIDQIKSACPGAPAEFVIEQVTDKATDVGLVKLKWDLYQAKNKKPDPPKAEPVEPTPLVVQAPCTDPVVEPRKQPEPEPVEASPVNPPVPAPQYPWWMLAMTVQGAFVGGWIGARMKTFLAAKIADVRTTFQQLSKLKSMQNVTVPTKPNPVTKPAPIVAKTPVVTESNDEQNG